MSDIKVAVVGASGVVGRAVLEALIDADIPASGFSRRPPADLPQASFVALDLLDSDGVAQVAKDHMPDVTHLVYAALFEKPGLIMGWHEADQMQTNLLMLQNPLEPRQESTALRHVTLLQGTKAYGAHVGPMKIPGLERDPRHQHDNFYWLQQDYLEQAGDANNWSYTIWRPQVIFGHALHAPMNMLAALGVYAALRRHKGLPMTYPGGTSAVSEAIDADLLAAAILMSFDNPAFAGETFNITNGDAFRWQDLWPSLAELFHLPVGDPEARSLVELYDEEAVWLEVSQQHGLKPYSIRDLVGDSFYYADALLNVAGHPAPPPALLSTIKLRQAGFNDCIDTVAMFERWYGKLAALKVLPSWN